MDELMARLERAEHGAFVLDCAIHEFVYGTSDDTPWPPKPYTVSVDAALMLVPEGWTIDNLKRFPSGEGWVVLAKPRENPIADWHKMNSYDPSDGSERFLTHPLAIAICIAALRARSTQERG